ncbi:MAG: sulfurtransferase [Luteolibacter sp.]
MATITNISTYLFAELSGLKELREELLSLCKSWDLKGTILLSTEGINMFVAGDGEKIEQLLNRLRSIPGLEKLTPKISYSDHQPFNRMLVRIKKEIISFGVEAVRPANYTSPKLPAVELKKWLDEGRPVTLLDTRNDYEVKLGTFKNAIIPNIDTFRQFPDAVRALPEELKDQPVVMFCTGGIRCEKAGPFMELEGFKNIYQLEGGILKYFEEVGGDHYEGECFVFDQRVGVDPGLRETDSAVCYACQAPLDAADQEDPRYVSGKSCPHCYKSEPEILAEKKIEHQAAIERVCNPLPGSVPYENRRHINVPAVHEGKTLLETLIALFPHISREEWKDRLAEGRFRSPLEEIIGEDYRVKDGERLVQIHPEAAEPAVATDIRIVDEDDVLLVIQKPSPLPMHASGRFNRNTLQHILTLAYGPKCLRPVHRLDANTSGLVLFGRTRLATTRLQQLFLQNKVEKTYLVCVRGLPEHDEFFSESPISTEAGPMGTREIDEENGQSARTDFKVIERRADGTALLEAKLGTGRTNQIRVHLWELGLPVVGDPAYLPGGKLGNTQTLDVDSPPLQLHAWKLSFKHPRPKERVTYEATRPEWA